MNKIIELDNVRFAKNGTLNSTLQKNVNSVEVKKNSMLKVKGLNKHFGKLHVLKDLNFELEEGKIHAIIGPNGSGKTTLIKSILGLVIPEKGVIELCGQSVKDKFLYRKKIGYMPQIARFPENLTPKELIAMIRDIRDQKKSNGELKFIEDFELNEHINKKMRTLSGGTRQKVNALLALMFDAPLLIFDEPTAGLDPISRVQLKDRILAERHKGKTIILTTHIMSQVEELSDDVIILIEGKIYFKGTIHEIKEKYKEDNMDKAIAKLMIESKRDTKLH